MPVKPLLCVAFWLTLVVSNACHDTAPPERVVFDIVSRLPHARVWVEPRSILPASAEGRLHLGNGWWNQPETHRGDAFVWSFGAASVVVFDLTKRRPLPLRLDGRPYRFPGAPQQVVTLEINGQVAGRHPLAPGRSVVDTTIDPELLKVGRNELTLRYGYATAPADIEPGARDTRRLGVAWYGFHFAGGGAPELQRPRAATDGELLFLPNGTAVELFDDLPASSALVVDRWAPRGDQPGALEVLVQTEGGPEQLLAHIDLENQPPRIALPGQGVTRLVLRSLRQAGDDSGVAMVGARVVAPPDPKEAEAQPPQVQSGETRRQPHILIYLIDTLRADHLGTYGYHRPVSPAIDAWAQTAVVFEHAIAQSSWTKASVASILTGLSPLRHGANLRADTLSADAQLLGERLRQAGYATAAIITNPNITSAFGFDQGYDLFVDLGEEARAQRVVDAAFDWLDARPSEADRPFFLYLHTIDPHAPYTPPEAFRTRLAPQVSASTALRSMAIVDGLQADRIVREADTIDQLEALYDAEIATNDAAFGALLAGLRDRGLENDTLIVLVSDHGEEFGEHGNFQHGRALHRESLHVPLIIKLPGVAGGRRVDRRVQHLDIVPTVLAAAGLPRNTLGEGTSLLPWIVGGNAATDPGPRVFSYLHLDGPARASVYESDWKLIQELAADAETLILPRLYHLVDDPLEAEQRAAASPVRTGYLTTLLHTWMAAPGSRLQGEEAVLDPELRERLRALGYLD